MALLWPPCRECYAGIYKNVYMQIDCQGALLIYSNLYLRNLRNTAGQNGSKIRTSNAACIFLHIKTTKNTNTADFWHFLASWTHSVSTWVITVLRLVIKLKKKRKKKTIKTGEDRHWGTLEKYISIQFILIIVIYPITGIIVLILVIDYILAVM